VHRTAQILARGDPGFFDFIKKVGGGALKIGRAAFGATPAAAALGAARGIFQVSDRPPPQMRSFEVPAGTGRAIGEIGVVALDRSRGF